MMFEEGLFIDLLMRAINGGVAALAVYWFLEQPFAEGIMDWLRVISEGLTASKKQVKRYFALVVATILSVGLYSLTVAAGVAEFPLDWVAWLDLIIWLGGLTFAGSQMVHSRDLKDE